MGRVGQTQRTIGGNYGMEGVFMTVRELIARLQTCNPDGIVSCDNDNDIDSYSENIFITDPESTNGAYCTITLHYERT